MEGLGEARGRGRGERGRVCSERAMSFRWVGLSRLLRAREVPGEGG